MVCRAICGATRCLPQTIIFELLASNFQHLFLNNTKKICGPFEFDKAYGFNTAQESPRISGTSLVYKPPYYDGRHYTALTKSVKHEVVYRF